LLHALTRTTHTSDYYNVHANTKFRRITVIA